MAAAPPALLLGLALLLASHLSTAVLFDQQTPDVQESEGLQAKTISLTEECAGKADEFLGANLAKCSVTEAAGPDNPVDLVFQLKETDVREFDLYIKLRTSVGGVTMSLKYGPDPTDPDSDVATLYSTSVRDPTEFGLLSITRDSLMGGSYWIHIEATTPAARFTVLVSTPTKPVMLDPADVAAIKEMHQACCPQQQPGATNSTHLCTRLQNAVEPARVPESDLCNTAPNMCTETGRLFRLVLRPDTTRDLQPLQCAGGNLPLAAISKLDALEYLDLTNNGLGGTVGEVAAALKALQSLGTLWLNNNTVSGNLTCDLIEQNRIQVIRLRANQITGTIPACYMASPDLATLDLSRNSLEGPIPAFTRGIPLRLLNLRSQTGEVGLSGSLPASLALAVKLETLDIVGNSIEGPIPPLPASLEVAYLDDNKLTGPLPSLGNLANITFFTASNNNLTGALPSALFAAQFIQAIDLSNNSFKGPLDDIPWDQVLDQLTWIDLSWNQLTGTLPALPLGSDSDFQVTSILLAGNKLNGTLDEFASVIPPPDNTTDPTTLPEPTNPIIRLDLSDNQLTGSLPRQLAYLSIFNGFIDGWGTQGIPPLLDLSNNELTGSFPMWVYPALSKSSTSPLDAPYVDFGGNYLDCPRPGNISEVVAAYQAKLNLTCYYTRTGQEVNVLDALKGNVTRSSGPRRADGTPPTNSSTDGTSTRGLDGSRSAATATGTPQPQGTTATGSSRKSKKKELSVGAIIGIAVGGGVGAALLLVAAAVAVLKLRAAPAAAAAPAPAAAAAAAPPV